MRRRLAQSSLPPGEQDAPAPSRRDLLRAAAFGLYAAGTMNAQAAKALFALVRSESAAGGVAHAGHAGGQTATSAGTYVPKVFNTHEWATVCRLAEMIVPADERSGSAVDAGAPEFIDLLCSVRADLGRIFLGGMQWVDAEMRHRGHQSFVQANETAQAKMLDELAEVVDETTTAPDPLNAPSYEDAARYQHFLDYTTKRPSPMLPGARFFGWMRRLAVDAFYSSEIGIADVGYEGNKYLPRYTVPQEAIDYAVRRSPFRE